MLFGVASLFYFYEFFARVAPGVLHSELMKVSGASEGAFGFSMSLYFLAYAPAQLLVGRPESMTGSLLHHLHHSLRP